MHPSQVGQAALWATLLALAAAAAFSAGGVVRRRPAWVRLGRDAVLLAFVTGTVASAALVALLVGDDFSVRYVAERSARSMPLAYKIGAWWGGQEGSLLLWLWLLLACAAFVVTARPDGPAPHLWPAATTALAGIGLFFTFLVTVLESPFERLLPAPADGVGLNPLLQSPSMLLHPLALYLGYVGLSVPFSFALASLAVRDRSDAWVRVTRRWAMLAWGFLGLGILLGGEWAYKELGWGGYWGWDPVENSSLVPWLLATAFIHSGLAQERRGTLRRWNVLLVLGAFVTVLLGTFVTRSGILASVHAFAESPTGPYFLSFIGLMAGATVWLVMQRWGELGDRERRFSLLSREGAFIAGNLVLASVAFAAAFGTAVPIVSRLFGPGITVQAPYFERVTAPLFVAMLFLMGIGMVLPWQLEPRPGRPTWVRRWTPVLAGAVVFGVLLWIGGLRRPTMLLGLVTAYLVGGTALAQAIRGLRPPRRLSPGGAAAARAGAAAGEERPWRRGWQRWGGYLAHAGVALMAVAVLFSTAFQVELSRSLAPGESASVAGYTVRYDGLALRQLPDATEVFAALDVYRRGQRVARLEPSKRLYRGRMAEFGATTEVAVHRRLEGDLYVVLAGWDERGERAAFEMYVTPMVDWLWAGGVLTLSGTLLAVWTAARRDPVRRRAIARIMEEAARLGGVRPQRSPAPPSAGA